MIKCYDKIVYKKVDDLVPYSNNARNNERAIEALVKAIPVMGFNVPIVIDKDNVIVKGHSRLEAVKRLGLDLVPCIVIDGSPEDIAEERLLDNKLSELAVWDDEKLKYELRELNLDLRKFDIEVPAIHGAASTGMLVTEQQLQRESEQLVGDKREVAHERKNFVELHCPHCGEDFYADLAEVEKYAV